MVNVLKTKDKFIRAAREQRHIYREMMIRTRLTFHKKDGARKKKPCPSRISYPAKIFFKNEGRKKNGIR